MEFEPSFFEEEERWGYTVPAEMKKVWAVQLDLLDRFEQVCRENGLRYYAIGGTLIGAVRHQGYIPWDDDVDVMMMREDYEKLLAVAPRAFEAPYFLQAVGTDKGYSRGHAQLRNSNTTAILRSEKGCFSFNQGIFIDIFPADAVPDDPAVFAAQRRRINFYEMWLKITVRYANNPRKNVVKNILHAIASIVPYRWIFRRMIRECTRYNGTDTQRVGPLSFVCNDDKCMYPRAGFAGVQTVPFENRTIDIPTGYDEILRTQYGDYQKVVKGGSYHGQVLFDTERSYLDYLNNGGRIGQ